MDAGKLQHRVDIQSKTVTQDATTGEVTETWATLHECVPAHVEPLSVREFIASGADQSAVSARITIRYRTGLTAEMRILHRGRTYNPMGFLADNGSGLEYFTIPCSEGVNAG